MATKYELGNVSSEILVRSLYDQQITATGNYELNYSIEEYKFIGVVVNNKGDINNYIYPVEVLKFLNGAQLVQCYGYYHSNVYNIITLVEDCLSVVEYFGYPIVGVYGIR